MIILSIHCIIFATWASEIFQNCIGSSCLALTWPAECLIFDVRWDKLDTSWAGGGDVMYAYQWGERWVLLVFSRSLPWYSPVSHDVLLYYSLPALCSQSSGPWSPGYQGEQICLIISLPVLNLSNPCHSAPNTNRKFNIWSLSQLLLVTEQTDGQTTGQHSSLLFTENRKCFTSWLGKLCLLSLLDVDSIK